MKSHLRKTMKATLAAIPPEQAAAESRAAREKLIALEEFRTARAVMLYLPIPGEVDCVPVALAAWQDAKTVLVPKVGWEQRHMIPVRCRSIDDEMIEDRYGLRTPAGGEPWPAEEIDLIVVPALAYDRQGHRLGRGGGFYDRFLAREDVKAVTCGLAFHQQVVDQVPCDPNDHPVDILVTDRQVLRLRRRAGGDRTDGK